MTLADLENQWTWAKAESLWRWLVIKQGWFCACREAVQSRDRASLEAWWNVNSAKKRNVLEYAAQMDAEQMFQVHLLCALVAYHAKILALCTDGTLPKVEAGAAAKMLTEAMKVLSLPSTLPEALDTLTAAIRTEGRWLDCLDAVTLADVMLAALRYGSFPFLTPQPSENLLRDLTRALLIQPLRTPEASVVIKVLLVDTAQSKGVAATLTLERIPGGSGMLYPVPEILLLQRDKDWYEAERNACLCVLPEQPEYDLRWRLDRLDGQPFPQALIGNSAGAAFATGIAKLIGAFPEEVLKAIDTERLAITAAIDAQGHLSPIGGVWAKLVEAAQVAAITRSLDTVVVAEGQEGVPPGLQAPEATPLRVLKASTLSGAMERLSQEQRPRVAVREYERQQCEWLEIVGKEDERIPIETHYQTLPLLRKVKVDSLPRADRAPGRNDEEGSLPAHSILRWEEQQRQEESRYERHTLEEVFGNRTQAARGSTGTAPRLIVLGPPGSGKTTLNQLLAWRATTNGLIVDGMRWVPARIPLREWEAWATRSQPPEYSLPKYLAARYGDLLSAPTAEQWRIWLQQGTVLLLLDGLDEVSSDRAFLDALKAALALYTKCPTVLTCRTVSFERHQRVCGDLPVYLLGLLEDAQRDAFIRLYPAEHSRHYQPDLLIEQLRRMPQMLPLAANPLLLSLLCLVVDDPLRVVLPATRSELYERTVEKLLNRPKRRPVTYPDGQDDLLLVHKRRILEHAAFRLFAEPRHSSPYKQTVLEDALKQGAESEGLSRPAEVANGLLADLTHNSGLLRSSPEQGYFFLHLTLEEYFVATHLARLVTTSKTGWKTRICVEDKAVTVYHLVNLKAWDAHWQEVITLMVGQVEMPAPLLRLLAERRRDDVERHRLCLAAICLPEIPPDRRVAHQELIDKITSDAFFYWWKPKQSNSSSVFMKRTLLALLQAEGRISGLLLFGWVLQRLQDLDRHMRDRAAIALGQMGSAAATPEALSALLQCLQGSEWLVRSSAAIALGQMGSAAATSEALSALLQCLQDLDRHMRGRAAKALGHMGGAAATSETLSALLQCLKDPDDDVRSSAAYALGQMGSAAATSEALSTLLQRLKDPDRQMRSSTAYALGQMGGAAATSEVLAALLRCLKDPDESVRDRAAKALEQMGSAAATSETLSTLLRCLKDWDWRVRERAAEALGAMGSAAATPEVLSALLHCLQGTNGLPAAYALGQMGGAAATSETLSALLQCLKDWDDDVRSSAAYALGQMGSAAATPEALSALLQRLQDSEWLVRARAADALGQMGSAAATPEVLSALLHCLKDPDRQKRSSAAEAFGAMGSAAATSEVLSTILQCLRDPDEYVRYRAECALKSLMQQEIREIRTWWGRRYWRHVSDLSRL